MRLWSTLVCSLLALTAACDAKITRNYLFRVTIDTPNGIRHGEGVIRLRASSLDTKAGNRSPEVYGQSIPFHLKDGKYVFMLVDSAAMGWEVYAPWIEEGKLLLLESGTEVPVDKDSIPEFATFRNNNIPETVLHIDMPINKKSSEGYRLVSMSISRTNMPVSSGIQDILPWANGSSDQIKHPSFRDEYSFENIVRKSSFMRKK